MYYFPVFITMNCMWLLMFDPNSTRPIHTYKKKGINLLMVKIAENFFIMYQVSHSCFCQ